MPYIFTLVLIFILYDKMRNKSKVICKEKIIEITFITIFRLSDEKKEMF